MYIFLDDELHGINSKLNMICDMLATIKLDIIELKEKMDNPVVEAETTFSFKPMTSLTELEALEESLKEEEKKIAYVSLFFNITHATHIFYVNFRFDT